MQSDGGNETIFTTGVTPLKHGLGTPREVTEEDLANIIRESMQNC